MTFASKSLCIGMFAIQLSCSDASSSEGEGEFVGEGEGEMPSSEGEGESSAEGEGEEGEGESPATGEGEGEPGWPEIYSQDGVVRFAAMEHVIRYERVSFYGFEIIDLSPLRGVVFETDDLFIEFTSLTTTAGLDSAVVTSSLWINDNPDLVVVEGFEASPDPVVYLGIGPAMPTLERIDLPFLQGPANWWPTGSLCTILTPNGVGVDEYCARVRTEVPTCGTPENPQPATLVTGCPE
jgi:hypothetical protein